MDGRQKLLQAEYVDLSKQLASGQLSKKQEVAVQYRLHKIQLEKNNEEAAVVAAEKEKQRIEERAREAAVHQNASVDYGTLRTGHRHVETLIKARKRFVTVKQVALEKLEHNKTLDYDPELLENMSYEQMIDRCKRYHLKTDGTMTEVKNRLAELMVRERTRSNAYRKKVAGSAGAKVKQSAAAIIQKYEMESLMHQEEFAGLHGIEPQEQELLTKLAMKKGLGDVMATAKQTRSALGELQEWHDSFEPVEPSSSHLTTIEQALAGLQAQDWMQMKEDGFQGKEAVETKVDDAFDQIRRNTGRLKDLEGLIKKARQDNAENARKLAGLKHQEQRLGGEYERKTQEKDSKQAAVGRAKHDVKVLKEKCTDEQTDFENAQRKMEKEEALLQSEIDALKQRYDKEIDALHRKHEEIQKSEGDLIRKKNEKLMKLQAEADRKHEKRRAEKLQQMLKDALAKEEAEIAALHDEIDAEETAIAELLQKIKDKVASKLALQGEVLRLTQQAMEAREAEEDAERAAKRDREMWKELEDERTEFEWYMKYIAPTAGEPSQEKECQAGSDDEFDQPMIDGGAKLEASRLHFKSR